MSGGGLDESAGTMPQVLRYIAENCFMLPALIAFVALAAAEAPTQPLTGVRDSYPALSPDGLTLLFHSNRSGRQAIWSANADGSNPHILFDDPNAGVDPGTPVWSPDGSRIAF